MRRPLCAGLLLFLICYLAATLGMAKGGSGPENAGSGGWDARSGEQVQLTGEAVSLYEPADGSQGNLSFILQNITTLSDTESSLSGKNALSEKESELFFQKRSVLCKLKTGETLPNVGSSVRVRGIVLPFLEATNPGEFDAKAYYELQGVAFSLNDAEILAQSGKYDRIGNFLYAVKYRTAVFYQEVLGKEDGATASAMVLGIKRDMDAQVKSLYQDAGIAHVLAISGLHITFIGMTLFRALKKLRIPLPAAAALSAVILQLYGKMAGMGISTQRAVLMFDLALAAQLLKRTPDTITSLAFAACVILLKNPQQLLDSGFQLSFLAVTGAATVVPVLQEEGIKAPDREDRRWKRFWKGVKKSLAASFGITLSMLPALLYHFYKWNPWSCLINLMVIPLMGVLLVWLLFLGAACWLLHRFAWGQFLLRLLALPASGILGVYRGLCQMVLGLPGSSLHTGAPKTWQLIVFCVGIAALLFAGKKVPPGGRMIYAVCLSMVFMIRLPGKLTITMLDVGQGECVCIETSGHHVYLLDAGSSSKKSAGQYQIIPFLEYSGVRRMEGIFVTHWDADHINALSDIFEWAKTDRVKIRRLFLPDTPLADEELERLVRLAEEYGIGIERIRAGQSLEDHEMKIACLHPYEGEIVADRNGASLALKLTCGAFSALFTGDLEKEGEQWLTEHYGESVLDCMLLDAGHHGSANASTKELLNAAAPQAVLVSCGRNNRYGHPAPETMARIAESGASCYVTAKRGAISAAVGKDGLRISAFLEERPDF